MGSTSAILRKKKIAVGKIIPTTKATLIDDDPNANEIHKIPAVNMSSRSQPKIRLLLTKD